MDTCEREKTQENSWKKKKKGGTKDNNENKGGGRKSVREYDRSSDKEIGRKLQGIGYRS